MRMCVYVRMCTHRRGNGMGRGRGDRELGMGMEKAFWSMFIMHQRKKGLWAEVRVTVES